MIRISSYNLVLLEKKIALFSNGHFLRGIIAAALRGGSYRRHYEYPWISNNLAIKATDKILDIGCGNNALSLFLASNGVKITAVDIVEEKAKKYIIIAEKMGLKKAMINGSLRIDSLDARKLPYSSEYFDKVLAISCLEHFRGDGDTQCIKEMSRVLKPGGCIGITVPFSVKFYKEESNYYVPYYEKRYDLATLNKRLILPSGLDLVKIAYAAEKRFKFHRFFYTKGKGFQYALGNFMPLFSKIFYGNTIHAEEADIACIILRKGIVANKARAS